MAVAVAAAGLTGAGLVTTTALPAQAAPQGTLTDFGFDAQSYGSQTTGNENADSGATALSNIPCTRYVPRSNENFVEQAGDGDGVALSNGAHRQLHRGEELSRRLRLPRRHDVNPRHFDRVWRPCSPPHR